MTTIEINLETLKELQLTPDEYIHLWCLHRSEETPYIPCCDIDKMEGLGYIKITEGGVTVRKKFTDLIEGDFDKMFMELLGAYPLKVGTHGNYRMLRAHDPNAKANAKTKEKYKKIVNKNPELHRKIISLLHIQLEHQRDKLQFLNALEVWVNNRVWEQWDQFDDELDEFGKESNDGRRNTQVLD